MNCLITSRGRRALAVAGVTLIAVLGASRPALALSTNSMSGTPGQLLSMKGPVDCHAEWPLYTSGYQAYASTPTLIVGTSALRFPQTVERWTGLEYSTDNGVSWTFWKWAAESTSPAVASATSITFAGTDIPLGLRSTTVFSYRVVEEFIFKSGTTVLGTAVDRYGVNDYWFSGQAPYGPLQITPTRYSAGCTVS